MNPHQHTIQRELRRRESTYPKLIKEQKLSPDKAEYYYTVLKDAINMLYNTPTRYTRTEIHTELTRELRMRRQHYPNFVQRRILTPAEANQQIQSWIDLIDSLFPPPPTPTPIIYTQGDLFA